MTRKVVRLGDAASLLIGFAFKSEAFLGAEDEGVRLLRGDNVQQGYIRWGDKTKKWALSEYDDLDKYQLEKGDVILAMDRPIVGDGLKFAWIAQEDLPAILVQRVCCLRGKPNIVLTNFLRYVIADPKFSAHIHKITTGANIPHISGKDIAAYEYMHPDLQEQEEIVAILSAYDDLIAANQRRIQLLEESARLLYHEWFVKLRFPGHETQPVTDGVPEGWKKRPLSELADVIMGQSPESKHFNEDGEGLPFHQGVSDFGDRLVTHSIFSTHATRIAQPGDILCSVRAPVGRLNGTLDKIIIGWGLSAIRSKMGTQSLLFYQMKNLFFKEDLIGGGAIFASVGKKELLGQELLHPSEEVASAFENFASGADQQIDALTLQIRRLQEARDMLLPKLISGALDVSRIAIPKEVEV